MTTKIRVLTASNLFIDNDVVNLKAEDIPGHTKLTGVCWIVAASPKDQALKIALRSVFELISKKLPNFRAWLLVANSTWQPDTRIVRHNALWGALAKDGIKLPEPCTAREVTHVSGGKLKFYGAVLTSIFCIDFVTKVLLKEKSAYVAVVPEDLDIDNVLALGWSGNIAEDAKIIDFISRADGFIVKLFGEFDDVENGILGIGGANLLAALD